MQGATDNGSVVSASASPTSGSVILLTGLHLMQISVQNASPSVEANAILVDVGRHVEVSIPFDTKWIGARIQAGSAITLGQRKRLVVGTLV